MRRFGGVDFETVPWQTGRQLRPRMNLFAREPIPQPDDPASPAAGRWRRRVAAAALAGLAAAVVAGAHWAAATYGTHNLALGAHGLRGPLLAALVGAAVVVQLLDRRRRPVFLAALGVVGAISVLQELALVLLWYAAAVIYLARRRRLMGLRIAAVVVLWATVPAVRWFWLAPGEPGASLPLILLWASLVYSALYLLVEHRRARPGQFTLSDDLLYLVAPPRFVSPLMQPIPPGLLQAAAGTMDLRRALRTVGLGLYGAGLLALHAWTTRRWPHLTDSWPHFGVRFVAYYALAAGTIFMSIASFRVLGFDLPSGFNWPFASRSFAEFFRRWNHYVRDAVLTLFYYPLVGLLRRIMPPRAVQVVAPYLAIFVGAFLLNDLLVPAIVSPSPQAALARSVEPVHLLTLLVYWSLIVLPRVLRRGPSVTRTGWRAALEWLLFMVLYVAIFRVGFGALHQR